MLENSEIISSYAVLDFRESDNSYYLKLKISFIDKSVLFSKEFFTWDSHKYSYHWQDSNNKLLVRWDNAPFQKEIETYPHPKHEGNKILPSFELD